MLALLLSLIIFQSNPVDSTHQKVDGVAHESDLPVTIDAIFIIGNKVTKPDIILRELSVTKGQTYDKERLEEVLELDRSKLLNTRLFNTVEISILYLDQSLIDIVVKVTERWYTFPSPIFDLVDRNFNDWWQNQNKDFSRTNFGVKIYQNNFRGRNETLRFLLQLGYTQQFGVTYKIPYLDKRKQHGITLNFDYAENKNIAVRTENHKPVFFDSDETLKIRREYSIAYNYRRSYYNFHSFEVKYNNNTVNDTIVGINPEYFQNPVVKQRFFELTYSFNRDRRDVASYPLRGYRTDMVIRKQGLGIHNDVDRMDFIFSMARYWHFGKQFFFANYSSGYASFPQEQPYANFGALGYKRDFIRGYELYLVEGKSFILNRATLKKRILSVVGNMRAIPIEQFRKIPLDIYLKVYFDSGYAENFEGYNLNNTLSDRYLFGTGIGLDFVTYYDSVIRIEYTMNREQETGFFLHFRKEF